MRRSVFLAALAAGWALSAHSQPANFCMNGPGRKCTVGTMTVGTQTVTTQTITGSQYVDAGTFNVVNARLFDGGTAVLDAATVRGVVSAVTLDGGSIRGTTLNLSGAAVVQGSVSSPSFDGGVYVGTYANLAGNATVSGTVSAGVLDGGAVIGTTGNFSSTVKANAFQTATHYSSGGWSAHFTGVAAEGVNGGAYTTGDNVQPGAMFTDVVCVCAVAGVGGTNGLFVDLLEDGVSVANVELTGGDANACDDPAGTALHGTLNFPYTNGATYSLQVKATTDCATNPLGCHCNVVDQP
jgi:hypothetical protein